MPPLQALAALHGFWIMMVLLPVAWARRHLPPRVLRRAGATVTLLGLLALGLTTGYDLSRWWVNSPEEWHRFALHRLAFYLVTLTDLPLLQIVGGGVVCWISGERRLRAALASGSRLDPRESA